MKDEKIMKAYLNVKVICTLTLATLFLTSCINMSGISPASNPQNANELKAGKAIANAAHNIPWPQEAWWKRYHDAQLDALISQTISGSPNLRLAEARVALAQSFTVSTHAAVLPSVGANASTGRERFTARQFIPPPWAGNSDWSNLATSSLAYDLDLWGRKQSIWKATIDEAKASEAEVQQVKLTLITAVVCNYIQLSIAYEFRDISYERLALRQKELDIARRALNAGVGTELAVIEAEMPLSIIRVQIEAIDQHIALIGNQIAAMSGQGPGAASEIKRPKVLFNATIGLPDELPANLIGRRPDILAHRWHMEAAAKDIESAKADFYPNINLLAFVGFQALGFGQFISGSSMVAGIGPAISLPIFDGGKRRGNLSAKTAEYDIAVEKYNDTLINALQDVSKQLLILQSNSRQHSEVEIGFTLVKKSYALAQKSYQAGLENYQHVIVANANLLVQQELMVSLQGEQLQAYAELMQALGGGIFDAQNNRSLSDQTKVEKNIGLGAASEH